MRQRLEQLYRRLEDYFSSELLSFRQLLDIAFPVVWEQAFLAVMTLVSLWMMARDGENALSVVNMMAVVNQAFLSVCLGLVTGGTVLVAQNCGAGRQEEAGRSMLQSIGLAVGFTTALSAVLVLSRNAVTAYLLAGADAEIVSQATLYFTGFCVSFPFYALYQSYAGCMRGFGRTGEALKLTLAVNGGEVLLTGVFALGLRMGVLGITLAVALSRACGAVAAGWMLLSQRRALGLRWAWLRPDSRILNGILYIAIPLALEQFFFNSGKAVSQRFIASYGAAHMAANGVVNGVFDLINVPQKAMQTVAVTVVGMCVGSGDFALARRYAYKFLRTVRVLLLCLLPVSIPLCVAIIYGYRLSGEAVSLTYISLAIIYIFAPMFLGGSFTAPASLRGGGDARYVSGVALGCMWTVRVTCSYLFAGVFRLGVVGINLAMVIEWILRSYLYRERLKGVQWCGHRLIGER